MKATKAINSTNSTTTKSNLLYIFARLSESTCKKASNANLSKSTKSNLSKSKVTKANLSKANLLSIS